MARKFPDYARIRKDLAALDNTAVNGMNVGMPPALSRLPGMVVKTQLTAGKQTATVTLLSAKEEPVAASTFQVPPGYRPMPHPKRRVHAPAGTTPKK